MRIGGGGGVAADLVALVALEIPPFQMQRLPIAESRSFSDTSSRFLLLLTIFPSVSVSNLAIAVAVTFCKNPVALASTRPVR